MGLEMFLNRNLVIATMHEKEQVIAPILESELGVQCSIFSDLNTDILGTFTGETERISDPISTVRAKCMLVFEQSNADLAVASEGSFGAHPDIFFAKANEEIVMFKDRKLGLEIVGKVLTTDTNFDGKEIQSIKELRDFADTALFPSHGLIMRPFQNSKENITKGIRNYETLERTFETYISQHGAAWVETDMRAMHNPTRMEVIRKATINLIEHIESLCPVCETPGFVARQTNLGLPCSLCSRPSKSVLSIHFACSACSYSENRPRPDDKSHEDPMYCDFCNP